MRIRNEAAARSSLLLSSRYRKLWICDIGPTSRHMARQGGRGAARNPVALCRHCRQVRSLAPSVALSGRHRTVLRPRAGLHPYGPLPTPPQSLLHLPRTCISCAPERRHCPDRETWLARMSCDSRGLLSPPDHATAPRLRPAAPSTHGHCEDRPVAVRRPSRCGTCRSWGDRAQSSA